MSLNISLTCSAKYDVEDDVSMERRCNAKESRQAKLLHLQSLLACFIIVHQACFQVEQDASVSESSPHIANIGENWLI